MGGTRRPGCGGGGASTAEKLEAGAGVGRALRHHLVPSPWVPPPRPVPGPTLWSSIAAAQLVPALLAGPALSSSPRAALPLLGANSPPSPRRRSRAPSQRSITDRSAQARRPRGRLGNVVLCWGRRETEPPPPDLGGTKPQW